MFDHDDTTLPATTRGPAATRGTTAARGAKPGQKPATTPRAAQKPAQPAPAARRLAPSPEAEQRKTGGPRRRWFGLRRRSDPQPPTQAGQVPAQTGPSGAATTRRASPATANGDNDAHDDNGGSSPRFHLYRPTGLDQEEEGR